MTGRREFLICSGATAALLALPRAPARSQAAAWRPLFDGRSLKGWRFYQEGVGATDANGAVSIDNGTLHFLGRGREGNPAPSGHISTVEAFGNYHLRSTSGRVQRAFRRARCSGATAACSTI